MKRSWPTYIAVFVGTLVLIVLAGYVRISLLHDEAIASESGRLPRAADLVSIVLGFAGIHFVAMFAATPGWRRRSLYITRLPWGIGAAIVMAVLLFPLPDIVAELATAGNEAPETGNIIVIQPEGPPPGAETAQPPGTGETPAGGASEEASPVEVTTPGVEETAGPGDDAGTETGDNVQEEDVTDEHLEAEPLTTMPRELIKLAVAIPLLFSFLFVARSADRNLWRGLGFGRRRFWRHVGTGVAAYVAFRWAVLPVAQTVVALVFEQFGLPVRGHEAVEEFRETTLVSTRLALVLAITVRAPFFEEIVFRGVLFQTIKRYAGAAPGIIISAAIFALLHGEWFVIINIFFLGLLFGYLFDKTGSIVPGIVLHFLFNLTTMVLLVLTG